MPLRRRCLPLAGFVALLSVSGCSGDTPTSGSTHDQPKAEKDHHVACWGDLVGIGPTNTSATPFEVPISDVVELAASDYHDCAVHADGSLSCWGSNSAGELGNGTTDATTTPVRVLGFD